jgi:diaminohydroxyphosphoribosylaminopyrimidine deaminase/5-amino-6-(5-phosphoribosylamino)uracil reductase
MTSQNNADQITDEAWMRQALDLALRGQGWVEPNPMVGCVLVKDGECIGRGWHEKFGSAHAEVNAIADAASQGHSTTGATAYVTLEPCAHQGKTGPCSKALIDAEIAKIVIAVSDPFEKVAGRGIKEIGAAGVEVKTGVLEGDARNVLAPYLKVVQKRKPWVMAKWAMTLDGKIATISGDSKWISNEDSREIVHQLRSRVDAIMVGSQTVAADDPMLTARPASLDRSEKYRAPARVPLRVVVDSPARTAIVSSLVKTAKEFPTLIAVGPQHDARQAKRMVDAGCEGWIGDSLDRHRRLLELLLHLADRGVTNLMVEGGGELLGSFHDLNEIDEAHVFVAPKIVGGLNSISPVAGLDRELMSTANELELQWAQRIGQDVYIYSRRRGES